MSIKLLPILIFLPLFSTAQTVTNGDFESGNVSWGCAPEIQGVSVYGGTGSDVVAEVDQAAGLCQTISGFTVGSFYTISFYCSRRTTCGPATQSIDFSIDNGALPTQSVSRTGAFGFTLETFGFVATSTTHTITFVGTSPTTCGLIINDVTITLVSPLSINLIDFDVSKESAATVKVEWQTASETNNDFFTVERSANGEKWNAIATIKGAGNSNRLLSYKVLDKNPLIGVSYYRLKQTDFDGQFTYSPIKSIVNEGKQNIIAYPNPATNYIQLRGKQLNISKVEIFNTLGQNLTDLVKISVSTPDLMLDLTNLNSGLYLIKFADAWVKFQK